MAKGMLAGGKLHEHRKVQRWNDKNFNKAHGISKWKTPFEMASHASGIVLKRVTVEAKQPNSACRKCVKVQLKKIINQLLLLSQEMEISNSLMKMTEYLLLD